jgi:hypothetical protein
LGRISRGTRLLETSSHSDAIEISKRTMLQGDEVSSWKIGAHEVTLEPPDIYFVRSIGDVSPEEMARMMDGFRAFADGKEWVFWMTDISRLGDVPPATRKIGASLPLPAQTAGAVIYGGKLHQRVLAKLAVSLSQLVRGKDEANRIFYVATEAQARARIEVLRALSPRARGEAG